MCCSRQGRRALRLKVARCRRDALNITVLARTMNLVLSFRVAVARLVEFRHGFRCYSRVKHVEIRAPSSLSPAGSLSLRRRRVRKNRRFFSAGGTSIGRTGFGFTQQAVTFPSRSPTTVPRSSLAGSQEKAALTRPPAWPGSFCACCVGSARVSGPQKVKLRNAFVPVDRASGQ